MRRSVTVHLAYQVDARASLDLLVAVADRAPIEERLSATLDGGPVSLTELAGPVGGRHHLGSVPAGLLEVSYAATVEGPADPTPVEPLDPIVFSRPSRYCEADTLAGFAAAEFGGLGDPVDLLPAVSSWVGDRLDYVPGSSGPTDGAVATLVARRGVCRDYAHLTVALLRACGVAARVVSVYAPGLDPMDFHAVTEALVDGTWRVVDSTLLAPRSSLVRIATGRDAADTAFLTNHGGQVTLVSQQVGAVVDGDLPDDDVTSLVSLR
jgi:transglutaminase-like putative cysteine protease